MIYVVGSLRNPRIPEVSKALRAAGHGVFDEWFAAGPQADDAWRDYERGRGRTLPEALHGLAAQHVFQFDARYLAQADTVVLVLPAGRSAHLELGWAIGAGKTGAVLLDADPERYDVMYAFAQIVATTLDELVGKLRKET